jgi:hypothetical protein
MTHGPHAPGPRARISTQSGSVCGQDEVGKTMPVACRSRERRCRMHGGARGSGGPKGAHNGNYKHGLYTAEAIASRRWLRHQTREVRALAKRLRQL